MTRVSRAFALGGGVLLGAAGLLLGATEPRRQGGDIGLRVGNRPPAFSSTDLKGQRHTLEQYHGSVVVLQFWASWCPVCREEIPKLKQLATQWQAKGVRVLTVSADDDPAALKRFLAKQPLPYPVILDSATRPSALAAYQVTGIPDTYILGLDGRISDHVVGGGSDLLSAVAEALRAR